MPTTKNLKPRPIRSLKYCLSTSFNDGAILRYFVLNTIMLVIDNIISGVEPNVRAK